MFFVRQIPVVNQSFGFFPKRIKIERIDDSGFVRFENRPDNECLPSQGDYDLDTMLKAGVSLKATRTNILPVDAGEVIDTFDSKENENE